MKSVKKLLEFAIKETENIKKTEIFLVKDLFKGYEWNRISRNDRLRIGILFLNYVSGENNEIEIIEKASSGQQKYKKKIMK